MNLAALETDTTIPEELEGKAGDRSRRLAKSYPYP